MKDKSLTKITGDELEGIGRVLPVNKLYVVTYTPESAKRSLANADKVIDDEDYYDGGFLWRVHDILEEMYGEDYSEANVPEDLELSFGVIDNEYYDWLGNRNDTSDNRIKYVESLPQKKLDELWRKYDKGLTVYPYGIRITAIFSNGVPGGKTAFRLTQEQTDVIRKCLQKSLPDALISVYDCILKPEDFINDMSYLAKYGIRAVKEGKTATVPKKYYTQKLKSDERIAGFYIPVMIGKRYGSATARAFDWATDEIYKDPSYSSDSIDFSSSNWDHIDPDVMPCQETFEEGGINDAIKDALSGGKTSLYAVKSIPQLIALDDAEYLEQRFESELLTRLMKDFSEEDL